MLFQYILKYIGRILYHLMPNKIKWFIIEITDALQEYMQWYLISRRKHAYYKFVIISLWIHADEICTGILCEVIEQ
jgi:hypothetical protein